jgi:hypothetical protein
MARATGELEVVREVVAIPTRHAGVLDDGRWRALEGRDQSPMTWHVTVVQLNPGSCMQRASCIFM